MRRSLIAALATSALALAIPGAALAQHATHHASRASSHRRHHKRHAHTVRFVTGARPRTMTAVKTTATTITTTTTTETPGESVGTVLSFESGVLKITLGDGSVVAGKVTEVTELSCSSPTEGKDDEGATGDEGANGDEGDQSDQGEHGETPPGPPSGTPQGGDHGSGQGGAQGHSDGMDQGSSHGDQPGSTETGEPACTVASLLPGAKVQEAELTLTSAGAVWEKVRIAN
jgi:hypothetical protein